VQLGAHNAVDGWAGRVLSRVRGDD
jgi:hypothetical protein